MKQAEKNALAEQAEACLANGQLEQARSLYTRLCELDGNDEEAWLMLAAVLGETGSLDEAVRCAQRAIAVDPQYLEAYLTRAHLLRRSGRDDEAVQSALKAVEGDPTYAEAWLFLAGVAGQLQRSADAEVWAGRAVALEPDNADAHVNLANALYQQERFDEAEASYRRALMLQPALFSASLGLGNALLAQGNFGDAAATLEQALDAVPSQTDVKSSLGICYANQGRLKEAIALFRDVVRERSDNVLVRLHLGRTLSLTGELDAGIDSLNAAVRLAPDSAQARVFLGHALKLADRLTEAAAAFEEAERLAPEAGEPSYFAAGIYLAQGRVEQSIDALHRALRREPDLRLARSALVYALNYPSDIDAKTKFDEAQRWGRMHAAGSLARQVHNNSREPNRRLRIAYVSPDFRDHSVAFFIESLLKHHHSAAVETYCYANVEKPDARTTVLQAMTEHWRDVSRQTDMQAADQILADQIDILVDLAGHTLGGRLGVFALKPAPVQVSYLGYPATTGVAAIDYRLTDNAADPEGITDPYHVETLVRLPHGFLCYTPPDQAPPVAAPPVADNGYVTFGSFNHLCKISAKALYVWASILREVPDSRLVLKYKALSDETTRNRLLERFRQHAIAADRIDLLDFVPSRSGHLATYRSG